MVEKFTKEQIQEMSHPELFHWAEILGKQEQAEHIRKKLLELIEVEEAKGIIE